MIKYAKLETLHLSVDMSRNFHLCRKEPQLGAKKIFFQSHIRMLVATGYEIIQIFVLVT